MDDATGIKAAVHISPAKVPGASEALLRIKEPFSLVIFGASGDLSKRKLIPALYRLQETGYLPSSYAIVGFSRTEFSDEDYRNHMLAVLKEELGDQVTGLTADNPLIKALHYQPGHNDRPDSFQKLKERLEQIEAERHLSGNRLFYLSVAPQFFSPIIRNLCAAGFICGKEDPTWSRVIFEKPFGHDLESARKLNAEVTEALAEDQIYRIDHYLGKETVQNILSFRFGNSIFEPLFNQKYVDNIRITVAETLGMEGRRGAFYDTAGALRDIVQNHMLQLLCLIAMEPPPALDPQSIRDEKVKVLRSLVPMTAREVAAWTVRGQYGVGEMQGKVVKGYRQEEGVDPKSMTETYVALRVKIDNWRWAGVPFFLRTGKRLRKRVSEIAVEFKQPPLLLFQEHERNDGFTPPRVKSNVLILRIQPNEGISLSFACKQPGMKIQLAEVNMDFFYEEAFRQRSPEAYERLLLDALRGDASLFTRSDEVEHSWRFITSILDGWAILPSPKFPNYYPFTEGPEEAGRLMEGTQVEWGSLEEM